MTLLEREPFLSALAECLASVIAGTGQVVLLSGEAGIGKTALTETFIRSQKPDVRLLWGACDALFTPRPLGPLYDIAARLQGDLGELIAANTNPFNLFSRFLVELQQRPTIVVFEDIHWADEITLDLLRYIGRRITKTSALLILTYRDDGLRMDHPLRAVLGDLASSNAARHIPLPPLSKQAVSALVGERNMDAAALHRQTGGNPFFVTEVLGSTSNGIPPTVRDAVLARSAQLSPAARSVLEAAAVIGLRIEPWLLTKATGAEIFAAEECITVGMLVSQGEVLAFRHELARQTILAMISPLRKRALHQFMLDTLQTQSARNDDLARLAHHAEGAGDRAAVKLYAPAAARQAAKAGAHREAARLYELALHYADGLPKEEHALLLEAYAIECDHLGQVNEGITAWHKAQALWRGLGNLLKEGENLAYSMNMLTRAGKAAEAQSVCFAAIEILERLPPGRELALAYRSQAAACLVNRDCEEALVWSAKALDLAEQYQDAEVLAAIHLTIGTAWLFLDYERGRQYMESKIETFREAGLEARVAHMYVNLGSGSGELFQFHQADQYLAEGIIYAAERDLDSYRLYMQAWQAMTHMYLGRWQDADRTVRRVLEKPIDNVTIRITALVALSRLRIRRGEMNVQSILDEALALAIQSGNLQRLGPVRAARAEAAWLAGNPEQILEEVEAVYSLAVSKRHPWCTGELAFWRWRAGQPVEIPAWTAQPFALQISGKWVAAAAEWKRLGCPYEQARALADGDTGAKISGLQIFEQLGARSAAHDLRKTLRAAGQIDLPRKPRDSTRQNPFGLTDRQVEILALLMDNLNNAAIASRLKISLKTVDHHVSAILAGLDVHTREDAAALARNHPHFK